MTTSNTKNPLFDHLQPPDDAENLSGGITDGLGLEPAKRQNSPFVSVFGFSTMTSIILILFVLTAVAGIVGGTYAGGVWGAAAETNDSTISTPLPTSVSPSSSPSSSVPSMAPSTSAPTQSPSTSVPSQTPTVSPSTSPSTTRPSRVPSSSPSKAPTTSRPSVSPSASPTTSRPSKSPTTSIPSRSPSRSPTTTRPSRSPSRIPSNSPTTTRPSLSPTTSFPTKSPSPPTTLSPTMNCATISIDFQSSFSNTAMIRGTASWQQSADLIISQTGNLYIGTGLNGLTVTDGTTYSQFGFPVFNDEMVDFGETLELSFTNGAQNVVYKLGAHSGTQGRIIESYNNVETLINTEIHTSTGLNTLCVVNGNGPIKKFKMSMQQYRSASLYGLSYTPLIC